MFLKKIKNLISSNTIQRRILVFLCFILLRLNTYSQNEIKKSPLAYQADSLFIHKKFGEALQKYELSFKSGNSYCDDYYNAARCAAVLKNNSIAFKYLKLSIKNGFVDENYTNRDDYFHNIHSKGINGELYYMDEELNEYRIKNN